MDATLLPAPTDKPSRFQRLTRFLFGSVKGRIVSATIAVVLVGWGFWYNEHRHIGWGETFNPVYWFHRIQGDDLFVVSEARLTHGNRSLPEIALTFDDGPHVASRGQILDTLKRFGVHATFFDVGKRMMQNPDLLRRTLAEGHEVGNHSQNHIRLDTQNPRDRHREINDADIAYCSVTGEHLTVLRPPGMRYNSDVLADTKRLGYLVVGYTTASRDFDPKETPDFIADRTVNRTDNGSIILLHDYPSTAQALPAIITKLRAKGFRFVTISEMLAHLPDRPARAVRLFRQSLP